MENLAAILSAAALLAMFSLLVWGVARGSRRLLGNDGVLIDAVKSCSACAGRPVCETGAIAGWLTTRPAGCPNVERLQREP